MAYVVASEATTGDAATSHSQAIPAGHRAGDLLIAIVGQDAGGTAIAAAGWTTIGGGTGAVSLYAFYKWAASSSEADFSASSGTNDNWCGTIVVVRGANATTPINVSTRTAHSSALSWQVGAVTTTVPKCLVLYAWEVNGGGVTIPEDPNNVIELGKTAAVDNHQIVGYNVQWAAGAVPRPLAYTSTADSAQSYVIAIADDGNDQMPPTCPQVFSYVARHGVAGPSEALTFGAITDIAATIDGATCNSTAPSTQSVGGLPASGWGIWWRIFSGSLTADNQWWGGAFAIPATNMADKLFALEYQTSLATAMRPGGFIVCFADATGAWAAFTLTKKQGIALETMRLTALIDLSNATPLDSGGGAINWGAVTKVGYAYQRGNASTSREILLNNAVLIDRSVFVGGSVGAPVTPYFAARVLSSWSLAGLADKQGVGQSLARSRIQIGDGSTKTYFDATSGSLEFPVAFGASLSRRFWNGVSGSAELRIKASPADTIKMTSTAIVSAEIAQDLVIDPASSASASWDFAGLVLVGLRLRNLAPGVAVNGATLRRTRGIELASGASLVGCRIEGSLAPSAVTSSNPGYVSGCAFVSGGTGHALEITTPGTYTFSGNTFSGYGAAGTTNAAVYNNSGGAVTLNITGGGSTPTVRNGAVATTVVNSGATLTLTGLVPGSDIVILDAGTATERINVDAHGATTYAFNYTATGSVDICVFKAGYVPCFVRGYALTTSDASLPIAQVADRNYSNP
jgi:hypothetical protein